MKKGSNTDLLIERYPQDWQQSMLDLLLEIKDGLDQVRRTLPELPQAQLTEWGR